MSSFSASKIFRPLTAARVVRSGAAPERTQEQVLADWLEELRQVGEAERLREILTRLEAVCPEEPSGYLVRRDGLLVYEGPIGEIPEDPVALAREERITELMR